MEKDILSIFSLDKKVALITGASRGIGKEIAITYSKVGARLIICSRKKEEIDGAAERIREAGGDVLAVTANVSVAEDREKLIKLAMDWAGKIDILVNNAGANPFFGPMADISDSAWDKVFNVNLKGSFFLSKLVYHAWMKDHGGVVINLSSIEGFRTNKGINTYSVSKAALIHLTRCLASEWGHNNIRVNALAPGVTKTRFSQVLWDGLQRSEESKNYPIPRFGEVEDIIGAALLLASDASLFITGHTLVIDGGVLVK